MPEVVVVSGVVWRVGIAGASGVAESFMQIAGSEDQFTQDPAKFYGQPLAAWAISSQFDIIRDYNPTTGEELNKIIESTERPWNERTLSGTTVSWCPGRTRRSTY